MGQISTVNKMTIQQNLSVDAAIRKRRFVAIDRVKEDLLEVGIDISRAALHRYMQKLKRRDGINSGLPNDTVIVVMQRSTGAVINLTTTASIELVVAMIEAIPASA